MKRYRVVPELLIICLAMATCKTTSGSRVKDEVGPGGRRKALFEGYNSASKQFINRICIVPSFAIDKGVINPIFLMPEAFSSKKPEELVDLVNDAAKLPVLELKATTGSAAQEGTIEYLRDASASQLLEKVAGGLNVNMKFVGGSATGAANVALANGKTTKSVTQTLLVKLKGEGVQIVPSALSGKWVKTPYGEQVSKNLVKLPPGEPQLRYLTQECGDQYVAQVNYGVTFTASLKISAKMESDLSYISGQLSVNTPTAGGGNITLDDTKITSDIKVSLNMFQQGGKVAQLTSIFASPTDGEKEVGSSLDAKSSAFRLVNCNIKTMNDCIGVFTKVLSYATEGDLSKLKTGEEITLPPESKILYQIRDESRQGYVVTGYTTEKYSLADFQAANMFQDQGTASTNESNATNSQPTDSTTASASSPSTAANASSSEQASLGLPPSVRTKQIRLETKLRGLIDAWAFARDARQIVDDLGNRLQLNEVESELLAAVGAIQEVFELCGQASPKVCEEKAEATLAQYDDPQRVRSFVVLVEKILDEELRQATLFDYCRRTAIRRLQDGPNTPWRNSMWLLAKRTGATTEIGEKSILEYSLESLNARNLISGEQAGTLDSTEGSTSLQHINTFCNALKDSPLKTEIDYTWPTPTATGDTQLLLIEPLKYIRNLRNLTLRYSTVIDDVVGKLSLLPDLRDLKIEDASLPYWAPFSAAPRLTKVTLIGLKTTQPTPDDETNSETSYVDSTLRELLKNPSIGVISIENSNESIFANYDLREFPRAFDKKFISPQRRLFQVRIQTNDSVSITGSDAFFGYRSDFNENTCKETHNIMAVSTWTGFQSTELDLRSDQDLCWSPCKDQVLARCNQLKARNPNGTAKLVCESCPSF